jgi:hypothetical protein
MTTRNRTLAIGMAMEAELCREAEQPQTSQDQADHLTVGMDGAFVSRSVKESRGGNILKSSPAVSNGRVGKGRRSLLCAIWTYGLGRRYRPYCGVLAVLPKRQSLFSRMVSRCTQIPEFRSIGINDFPVFDCKFTALK